MVVWRGGAQAPVGGGESEEGRIWIGEEGTEKTEEVVWEFAFLILP